MNRTNIENICTLCIAFLSLIPVFGQELKPFQQGDRVAFLGNSITEAGYYESYVWLYYMTHFQNRRITVMNAGIGGDTAENMDAF